MSATAKAITIALVAGVVFGGAALVVERNAWLALAAGSLLGALVFFSTSNYYAALDRAALGAAAPPRWTIPLTNAWRMRRLVAAGRLDEAGRRLVEAGDWEGAAWVISSSVTVRAARDALLHLLVATRGLHEMAASLPAQTPQSFKSLARETALDVSQRLWAKTTILARLSRLALPPGARDEVVAEAGRVDELATQVEGATTDLLRLSLAGGDAPGLRHGTELLSAVGRKAAVLMRVEMSGEEVPSQPV